MAPTDPAPLTPPGSTSQIGTGSRTVITHRTVNIPKYRGPKRSPDDKTWTKGPEFTVWRRAVEEHCAMEPVERDQDMIRVAKSNLDQHQGLAYTIAHQRTTHLGQFESSFHAWMTAFGALCEDQVSNDSAWIEASVEALSLRRDPKESFKGFYLRTLDIPERLKDRAQQSGYSKPDAEKLAAALHEIILFSELPREFAKFSKQTVNQPMRLTFNEVLPKLEEKIGSLPYKPSLREEIQGRPVMPKPVDGVQKSSQSSRKRGSKQTKSSETCHFCKKTGHVKDDCYSYLDEMGKRCKRCRKEGHGKKDCTKPAAKRNQPQSKSVGTVDASEDTEHGSITDVEYGAFSIGLVTENPKRPRMTEDNDEVTEIVQSLSSTFIGSEHSATFRQSFLGAKGTFTHSSPADTDSEDDSPSGIFVSNRVLERLRRRVARKRQGTRDEPITISDSEEDTEPRCKLARSSSQAPADDPPQVEITCKQPDSEANSSGNEDEGPPASPMWSPSDDEEWVNRPRGPTPPPPKIIIPTKYQHIGQISLESDSGDESDGEDRPVCFIDYQSEVSVPTQITQGRIYTNLQCGPIVTRVLIDCGAAVTIVEEDLFTRIGSDLLPTNSTLVGAFGQRIIPIGKTFFNIYPTKDCPIQVKAYVVQEIEANASLMLGLLELEKHGAIINLRTREVQFLKSSELPICTAQKESSEISTLNCGEDITLFAGTNTRVPVYSTAGCLSQESVQEYAVIEGALPDIEGIKVVPGLIDINRKPETIRVINMTPTDVIIYKGDKVAHTSNERYNDVNMEDQA